MSVILDGELTPTNVGIATAPDVDGAIMAISPCCSASIYAWQADEVEWSCSSCTAEIVIEGNEAVSSMWHLNTPDANNGTIEQWVAYWTGFKASDIGVEVS